MRNAFSEGFYEIAKNNQQVMFVTADAGGMWYDKIRHELNDQYINVGIAEQNMIGISAGLAMAGKRPFACAIATFATMRCYEQIRVNLCCAGLPVTVVGVGTGLDYNTLGPTHQSTEDLAIMRALPGMTILSPSDNIMAKQMVEYCVRKPGPKYLRLDRTGFPLVYNGKRKPDIDLGFDILRKGEDLCIVTTGRMAIRALKLAEALANYSIDAGVVDLFKIKPINEEVLCETISRCKHIVTLEEHFIMGGIGSVILETLSNRGKLHPVLRFGIQDRFCRIYGKREYLQEKNNLDIRSLIAAILQKIKYEEHSCH